MKQELFDFTGDLTEQFDDLQEAVVGCVQMSKKGRQQIAHDMHLKYGYFMRMIDPNDAGANFPTHLLEALMEVCGNDIPLRYLNDRRSKSDEQRFREKMERIAESLPGIIEAVNYVKEYRKEEKLRAVK